MFSFWFFGCPFRVMSVIRYRFTEIRDEVPENFSERLIFLARLRQGCGEAGRGLPAFARGYGVAGTD
jgi:hypothetical protein